MSTELSALYRAYIDCLNRRAWDELGRFVHGDVVHNGRALGLSGYRAMLEGDVRLIPDLRFAVEMLVCDASTVAARLLFAVWSIVDRTAIEAQIGGSCRARTAARRSASRLIDKIHRR